MKKSLRRALWALAMICILEMAGGAAARGGGAPHGTFRLAAKISGCSIAWGDSATGAAEKEVNARNTSSAGSTVNTESTASAESAMSAESAVNTGSLAAENVESSGTDSTDSTKEQKPSIRSFHCRDSRPGCLLLQAVMTGSFETFDPEDTLGERVFSAVFPQMCAISEEDITHYLDEFGGGEEDLRAAYHTALANCLWANILFEGIPKERRSAEERVLLLFLNPAGEENAEAEMAVIRDEIDDRTIKKLADAVSVPEEFVRWLIFDQPVSPASGASSAIPPLLSSTKLK